MAPELRAKKPSASTAAKAKSAPKRKAGDDSSPVFPKKSKSVKVDEAPKKSKAKNQKAKEPTIVDDEHPFSDSDENENSTLALAGVDDNDGEKEVDESADYKEGQNVGKIPKTSKALETTKSGKSGEETGVVYIGRIPMGFYEHQMRQYFEQFGPINKLRLSRNKKTGKPKHYAFIEFAEGITAEIVAKTMDNYLLFGHILKVKLVPRSQIHDSLWKGANQRYKQIPHTKMEANKLKKPKSEAQWGKTISRENKKRADRAQKMKDLGYDFEAPELKTVEQASKGADALTSNEENTPKAIEAPAEAEKTEAADADDKGDGVESLNGDLAVKKPLKAKVNMQNSPKAGKKPKKSKTKVKA